MTNTPHDHTQCRQMFARLSEYIDNELDEITCRDIERHMADCPPCRVCLSTLKQTVALCKNLDDQPVPKDLSMKLKQIIDNLSYRDQ